MPLVLTRSVSSTCSCRRGLICGWSCDCNCCSCVCCCGCCCWFGRRGIKDDVSSDSTVPIVIFRLFLFGTGNKKLLIERKGGEKRRTFLVNCNCQQHPDWILLFYLLLRFFFYSCLRNEQTKPTNPRKKKITRENKAQYTHPVGWIIWWCNKNKQKWKDGYDRFFPLFVCWLDLTVRLLWECPWSSSSAYR